MKYQYYLIYIKLSYVAIFYLYVNFEKSLFNDKQLFSRSGHVHNSTVKESNINEIF